MRLDRLAGDSALPLLLGEQLDPFTRDPFAPLRLRSLSLNSPQAQTADMLRAVAKEWTTLEELDVARCRGAVVCEAAPEIFAMPHLRELRVICGWLSGLSERPAWLQTSIHQSRRVHVKQMDPAQLASERAFD